jgi:hypothetical protein
VAVGPAFVQDDHAGIVVPRVVGFEHAIGQAASVGVGDHRYLLRNQGGEVIDISGDVAGPGVIT